MAFSVVRLCAAHVLRIVSECALAHIAFGTPQRVCLVPAKRMPPRPGAPRSETACIFASHLHQWFLGGWVSTLRQSPSALCERACVQTVIRLRQQEYYRFPCVPHARKIAIPSHYLVVVGWLVAYLLTREVCEPDRPTDRPATGLRPI